MDDDETTQFVDQGHQLAKIGFSKAIRNAKDRCQAPVLDTAVGTVVCGQEIRICDSFTPRDPSERAALDIQDEARCG